MSGGRWPRGSVWSPTSHERRTTLRVEVEAPPAGFADELKALARKIEPTVRAAEFPDNAAHPAGAPPSGAAGRRDVTVELRVPADDAAWPARGAAARQLAPRGTDGLPGARPRAVLEDLALLPFAILILVLPPGCGRPPRPVEVESPRRAARRSNHAPGTSRCSSRGSARRGREHRRPPGRHGPFRSIDDLKPPASAWLGRKGAGGPALVVTGKAGGWRREAGGGGWRLEEGGWRLEAGGLEAGGWRLDGGPRAGVGHGNGYGNGYG